MELYQLRYFVEVARQRNFTRAAERLNLAQPALSAQVANLEAEVGAQLFQRGRRESVLTPAGETLLAHATAILDRADAALHAVQELVGLRGGRLSVGTIPSVSACLLPPIISAFRTRYPQIEMRLLEGTSEAIAEWVDSGRVELGFVQLPTPAGAFDEHLLLKESFVIVAARTHPISGRRTVDLAQLATEPFVFYKGRARDTALDACRTAGFEPRIACESGELETIRALVTAGLGLALLPQLAVRDARAADFAIIQVRKPRIERRLALLTRSSHTLSPAATAFQQIVQKRAH